MSAPQKVHFVILWESEIRKAAAMLADAKKLIDESANESSDAPLGKDTVKAIWRAFDACAIALHGADTSDAVLMLSAHQIERARSE